MLAAVLLAAALVAQLGPQYPPSGPTGQPYPRTGTGGTGLPPLRLPGKKKKETATAKPTQKQLMNISVLRGILRRMDESVLILEADDKRILTVLRSDITKLLKDEAEAKSEIFTQGDHLVVDAALDDDNRFLAVTVRWEKAATPEEREYAKRPLPPDVHFEDDMDEAARKAEAAASAKNKPAAQSEGPPKIRRAGSEPAKPPQADEAKKEQPKANEETAAAPPERATVALDKPLDLSPVPKIRRGRPDPKPRTKEDEELDKIASANAGVVLSTPGEPAVLAPEAAVSPKQEDPLLERAREAVLNFTESLPNFVVKQLTTRFTGSGKRDNWQPRDNFVADLIYDSGKEHYRNVMLNGKPAKGKIEESGAWSRGEFGTIVRDVFAPASNATFKPRGNATISNRKAKYYDFTVEQESSHWRVSVPGQTFFPGYRGSVWIDIETARVMRLEMQGRKIPEGFPIDTVETALDFDFVKIGSGAVLVPVHSETLSCFRGTGECSKNVIDFRNYRKFGAQSDLIFNQ